MAHTVHIEDDFDLEKIRTSGQCFRVAALGEGWYRFVARDKALYLRDLGGGDFECSCEPGEWDGFWSGYFDLGRDYSAIRSSSKGANGFIDAAMEHGRGLRILRQDPWEMLVTFIISQRKSMPAIATAVEALCESFGDIVATDDGIPGESGGLRAFPTPEQLASASEEDLRACGLGYRAPYVADAARLVASGELDLAMLCSLDDAQLFDGLKCVKGVGDKVANCVCLFGYGRTSQVPVDVWIARAIEQECEGDDPFSQYGPDAGIMQQYAFFFMTDRNRK